MTKQRSMLRSGLQALSDIPGSILRAWLLHSML